MATSNPYIDRADEATCLVCGTHLDICCAMSYKTVIDVPDDYYCYAHCEYGCRGWRDSELDDFFEWEKHKARGTPIHLRRFF